MLLKLLLICIGAIIIMNAIVAAIVYHILTKPSGRNVFGNCGDMNNKIRFGYERLSITSADGVRLNAYFVDNESSDCLIVILHGYGCQAKNLLSYINHFQLSGYNVLIPDLRGHGNSGGTCGLGYGDTQDILEWMRYLEKLKKTHYRRILFGTSMGATTAINVALCAGNDGIDAVIADSTAPDLFKIIEKVYRWKVKYPWSLVRPFLVIYIKLFGRVTLNELSLYGRIQTLDVPILFIHEKKGWLN